MALGAAPHEVISLVVRHAALLVTCGLVLGFAAAFGAGRLLESAVFGVQPSVSTIIGVAAGIMVVIAAVAAYVPANKAASVDPMTALRTE